MHCNQAYAAKKLSEKDSSEVWKGGKKIKTKRTRDRNRRSEIEEESMSSIANVEDNNLSMENNNDSEIEEENINIIFNVEDNDFDPEEDIINRVLNMNFNEES